MRNYLYELREANHFTQKDMSLKLGISESYYNLIERGERQKPLNVAFLYQLSKIFKLSIKRLTDMECAYLNLK